MGNVDSVAMMTLPRAIGLKAAFGLARSTSRGEAKRVVAARLRALGVERPEREAALLIAAASRISDVDLISAPEAPLGEAAERVETFAARRLAGEPLSRIVGRREFWGLTLAISPDVLDPRPETETIVEAVVAAFVDRRREALRVLDLGVGSGALLCAVLTEFPDAIGVGVDLSEPAAAIARANLEALGLAARVTIRIGDWGEALEGPFDIIVANPPYIRADEIASLDREVRDHDPRLALDGGADGLDAYRALAPQLARLLESARGRFFLEAGAGQAEAVSKIARDAGLDVGAVLADLSGRDRVVAGRLARS